MIGKSRYALCISFMMGCMVSLPSYAQDQNALTQEEINQLNADTIPQQIDPSIEIENAMDSWFDRNKVQPGVEGKNGKLYYSAVENVAVSPSNPNWVKSRQLAYEKAILAIRANFIKDQFGKSVTRTSHELEGDDSSNNREFPEEKLLGKSQIAALWDKALALGEGKLNQLLIDNGIDPAEFDAVPPAQRKDLFTDSYVKTTLTKAMGSSSGIVPIKTFDANDEKGNHAIGVIALYSPKLKQIAYDITHGREMAGSDRPGKEISAWYDHSPETLATTFGLRIAKDENGEFVLISFAQWGHSFEGKDENRLKRARKMAGEQAESIAVSQITNFMNANLRLSDESKTGELIENYLLKQGDDVTEKDITNIVDQFAKSVQQTSSGSIAGTRTVKRWSYKHPYGHEIIGRIKVWTRQGYETSQNVKNFKPGALNKAAKTAEQNAKKIDANLTESPGFGDQSDF